jgi:hypothetical protein
MSTPSANRIANSSPPVRAITSPDRTDRDSRAATRFNSWSPTCLAREVVDLSELIDAAPKV